eukprot:scaffold57682_cov82-Phaeocystis_antarctica.AAC.1
MLARTIVWCEAAPCAVFGGGALAAALVRSSRAVLAPMLARTTVWCEAAPCAVLGGGASAIALARSSRAVLAPMLARFPGFNFCYSSVSFVMLHNLKLRGPAHGHTTP